MRILSRYILREFLQPLTYCIITFCSLYVLLQLFDVFGALMENAPSAGAILLFLASTLAPFLEWIFSASFLLATLYTVWRLCRNSEISAMRASGVSFITISAPILATALVFSILTFLNTEYFVPRFAENAKRMMERIKYRPMPNAARPPAADDLERLSYVNVVSHRYWQVNRFDPAHPETLGDVHIKFEREDRSPEYTVTATSAQYLDGMWWLENPIENYYDELAFPIPSPAPLLNRLTLRAFPQLDETPADFRDETRHWEYLSFMARYRYIQTHPKLSDLSSRTYDMLYRLAAPWACLVMTLFAIPAGLATGRQSVAKGVLSAIVMFFSFYALTNLCMLLTKQNLLSPWIAAWTPNLLFLFIGLILFYRQR